MLKRNNDNQESKARTKKIMHVVIITTVIIALTFFCYFMKYSLLIPVMLLILGFHLFFTNKDVTIRFFLNLGLLLAFIVSIAYFIKDFSAIPLYYIPVASIAMLTILLFNDLQIAFIMSLASSAIVTLIVHGGFTMMFTFFLGSIIGSYSVRYARARGELITSGLFVSATNIVCLVLACFTCFIAGDKNFLVNNLYPLAANGFISAALVNITLDIFQYLFGAITNFKLLELSDFNQPLLKRMTLEALGTYQHSLMVSNLAEAAADSIGANSLLTRVGAYYHDIGKMLKPEYFTENQSLSSNKHDDIEPSISRLVILNHIKEGIEFAKKNKLHPKIIDFIPQHHGTSLMHFFYQKSLEDAQDKGKVHEEDYRYPGPKPQSRETAIVLLADSVEAASRSLDDPNPTNIEETVKKIVNNKFIDGQLDECNLTLTEINKISTTFTRILSAMYHSRVKYPDQKNGSNGKKPTEKDSSQSSENRKDS